MQQMWLCILSGRQFEGTFENTHGRKVKQVQRCDYACSGPSALRSHLRTHKWNKCNQSNYTTFSLRRYFKIQKKMRLFWLCLFLAGTYWIIKSKKHSLTYSMGWPPPPPTLPFWERFPHKLFFGFCFWERSVGTHSEKRTGLCGKIYPTVIWIWSP